MARETGCFVGKEKAFLRFFYGNFFNFVTCTNLVNHIEAFYYLAKAGMVAIEVLRILAAMADKELGASGVAAGMRHGKNAAVVVLIFTFKFAVDGIPGASSAIAYRTSALNNKVWYYPMETKPVVKAFFSQVDKIFHCFWSVFFIELHFHGAFVGYNFCCFHFFFV